jgi:hypothetical protein
VFVLQSWPAAYLPRARRVVTRIGHAPTPRRAPQLTSVKFRRSSSSRALRRRTAGRGLTNTDRRMSG